MPPTVTVPRLLSNNTYENTRAATLRTSITDRSKSGWSTSTSGPRRFYRYHVSAGELQHSVLIKMPPPNAHSQPPAEQAGDVLDRPRMTSTTDATIKHLLEYKALVAIQSYFERLADGRFGTVKPLTYLPDQSALLMEEVKTPNLNTLFGRTNRLQGPLSSLDLRDAFCNSGAWLRYYHTLPKDHDVQVRHATR